LFRTYLSRIETGQANPTLTMIHALASSLGVAVTALFEPMPGSTTVVVAPAAARATKTPATGPASGPASGPVVKGKPAAKAVKPSRGRVSR
jgi:transcriptional regulator with XRE-family HTH domain